MNEPGDVTAATNSGIESVHPPTIGDTPEPAGSQDEQFVRASVFERVMPFVIAAIIVLIDQISKRLVESNLELGEVWAPIPAIEPIFRILRTANTGAVFGLFQNAGIFFAILSFVLIGVIIYLNHSFPGGNPLIRVALGLQLGGALGNLIDRLRQGYVTDFVDMGPWYIFNVADFAIVSGTILFAYVMLREQWQEMQREREASTAAGQPDTD